ncbi:MAG: F0F1 ATP synthase subunit gamma [Planctomycetaceae bacterium]
METLKALGRRVAVADDVRGIVGTMKAIAAANIRQFEASVDSMADYNRTLRLGFQILFHECRVLDDREGALTTPSDLRLIDTRRDRPGRFGAIVFGSDQGLCGRFNEEICEYTAQRMQSLGPDHAAWSVISIGNRVQMQLAESGFTIAKAESAPRSLPGIGPFVQSLLPTVQRWQEEDAVERVFVFYNKRLAASNFQPTEIRLLPPDIQSMSKPRASDGEFATLPTYTMNRTELFRSLIRQYLFVSLFKACAESLASENASRIASMQAAEKTIENRLGELKSQLNERRQTAITEELLDIVTGYEVSTSARKDQA